VYIREGFRGPQGIMVAAPEVYTEDGLRTLQRMGYTEEVLGVEAVNRGRLAVTVDRWWFQFGNGVLYDNPSDPRNPQLPHRLDSFARAAWWAPAADLHDSQGPFTDQSGHAATLRAGAGLGSGRSVLSGNALLVRAGETRRPPVTPLVRLARTLARKARNWLR